jgi:2-dehydropantoate 2-reductase
MSRVEFAVVGAGAIGSILSAHLVRAGRSVVVIARGLRAQQIHNEGLRIKGLAEISIPVRVLTEPSQLHEAEVLIVAMKTHGTEAALQGLQHVEIGATFSIQNGLLKNELLAQTYGSDRVLGAIANTSGELLGTGEVHFTRNVNLLLGELGGGVSARAQHIAAAIDESGVRANAVTDIIVHEWSKFASWVGLMCMSVTTRAPTWQYLIDPDSALLLLRLVREVATLAKAHKIVLFDDGSLLPLQTILEASEVDAVNALQKAGTDFKAKAPDHRMSALQDLEAGRPLEIEETLGYAARKAQALKLALPLLDSFYHLATAIDRTRRRAASLEPQFVHRSGETASFDTKDT